MPRLERRALISFWVRVAVLLVVSLLPVPWLADAYGTGFAVAMNPVLALASHGSPIGMRFQPPAEIREHGSWQVPLMLEARESREVFPMPLDVRSFSYRPLATFFVLALASPLKGRRRNAIVLGLGGLTMVLVTGVLVGLPIAATLAAATSPSTSAARSAIETIYHALETPVMMYFLPTLVWWLFMWRTRPQAEPVQAEPL
jgi:hypothetical protein